MRMRTVVIASAVLLAAMAAAPAFAASSTITAGQAGKERLAAAAIPTAPGDAGLEAAEGIGMEYDVNRFALPEGAGMLVIVEGTGGSSCHVTAYEKGQSGWEKRLETDGYLGQNGMSNHRVMGDKTTPIGVFQMNTPFGQGDPLEGFPQNYIKVKESHVWADDTNSLVDDASCVGEHVGTVWYKGHYDYVLDAGFNKNAIPNQGSALFLHCMVSGKTSSSGCVAIPKDEMAKIMRLYGTYGDGACYIAQAPRGSFHLIYNSYGVNNGLSPEGNFDIFLK